MRTALGVALVGAGIGLAAACGGSGAPPPPVAGGGSQAGAPGQAAGQGQAAVQVGAKSAPPQRSTAFTIASRERADEGSRRRLRAKIVLADGLDSDRSIEAIRAAIQELLPADGEIEVVEVLVYKSAAETGGDWTFGHGFASKDGKGWAGGGNFGQGVFDRNNIEIDLRLPAGEEHFSLAR
jgi:hypothetical protein